MISSDALQLIDVAKLGTAGTFAFLSLLGAVYAVPWSRCSRDDNASKEYNKLWSVRLCLQLTAAAWLLCPFVQLYDSWSSHVSLHLASLPEQEKLCRVHAALRVGFVEPFFLLLSLLTLRQFLAATESCLPSWRCLSCADGHRSAKKEPRNSCIIIRAGAWSVAVLVLQSIVPAVRQCEAGDAWNDPLHRPLVTTCVQSEVCWNEESNSEESNSVCTACVIPFTNTVISVIVVAIYLLHSWKITVRMGQLAINQYIEKRMRLFRSSVSVLLVFSLLFRGLGVWWKPGHVLHEFCEMTDFLSMFLFMSALNFILVIRPIREARAADKDDDFSSPFHAHCDGCFFSLSRYFFYC